MIESIKFTNYKALRNTTLPLAPFTLLLGPNGSGKTSALQSIAGLATFAAQSLGIQAKPQAYSGLVWASMRSVTADPEATVGIEARLTTENRVITARFQWNNAGQVITQFSLPDGQQLQPQERAAVLHRLATMQTCVLDFPNIASSAPVNAAASLQPNGFGLAAVLDDLKDNHQERFDLLVEEMRRWLPEYDQILFDKPNQGHKAIALRTRTGRHRIPAAELSQGTIVALALLTLAYLPTPPSLIGLEEIDRGLHPRLLRHLQDALYRLSYPRECGESRSPIQVVATTHSPYLLDLYRDRAEEVVLSQKEGLEVTMKRLKDIDHYEEILSDAPLSEVWYSGVLGGVSVKP